MPEIEAVGIQFSIFPQIVQDGFFYAKVQSDTDQPWSILLATTSGQVLSTQEHCGDHDLRIDTGGLPVGVYWVSVFGKFNVKTKKVVVM